METHPVSLTVSQMVFLHEILRRSQITGGEAMNVVVLMGILEMAVQQAQAAGKPEDKPDDAEAERPD